MTLRIIYIYIFSLPSILTSSFGFSISKISLDTVINQIFFFCINLICRAYSIEFLISQLFTINWHLHLSITPERHFSSLVKCFSGFFFRPTFPLKIRSMYYTKSSYITLYVPGKSFFSFHPGDILVHATFELGSFICSNIIRVFPKSLMALMRPLPVTATKF